jgi:O-acetyl-ADP-ribose deacetylase (regulator of RNase III)
MFTEEAGFVAHHYLIGDATEPVKRPAMILHVCNDVNAWGRGFVLALRAKYPESERQYHAWFRTGHPQLGQVQFVQVTPEVCVGNMIAQEGIRWQGKIPPIRYDALGSCLGQAYERAREKDLTVHMPRIGCVLAGGDWNRIENIITNTMTVETYIYTLECQKDRWPSVYENVDCKGNVL